MNSLSMNGKRNLFAFILLIVADVKCAAVSTIGTKSDEQFKATSERELSIDVADSLEVRLQESELRSLKAQQVELQQDNHWLSIHVDELSNVVANLECSLLDNALSADAATTEQKTAKVVVEGKDDNIGTKRDCRRRLRLFPSSHMLLHGHSYNRHGSTLHNMEGVQIRTKQQGKKYNKLLEAVNSLADRVLSLEQAMSSIQDTVKTLETEVAKINPGGPAPSTLIAPSRAPTPAPAPGGTNPAARCGCDKCDDNAWNTEAPPGAGSNFTCGTRIEYKKGQGLTEHDACAFVVNEFPDVCAACDPDPDHCDGTGSTTGNGDSGSLTPQSPLYCYPPYNDRKRYTNVWGNMIIETKEDLNGGVCGPGNNIFSRDAVSVTGNALTLEYKQLNGAWTSSEVRIVLPEDDMPYVYGTYKFSVKSIQVIDKDGTVVSTTLPADIVLGMFTWNDLEDYASHTNWNHEVDVEISRWGDENNPKGDAQFLPQPASPGPHFRRFFTGSGDSYDEAGHDYQFTWLPTSIDWNTDANSGVSHTYSTKIAKDNGSKDYIQCLPSNIDIRINLWNMRGAVQPMNTNDGDHVEVVIDKFSYTPSSTLYAADGEECSKDCQCSPDSGCLNGICSTL